MKRSISFAIRCLDVRKLSVVIFEDLIILTLKCMPFQKDQFFSLEVPLLRIEGHVVLQLLETPLLNLINYASLIATNEARHRFGRKQNWLRVTFKEADTAMRACQNMNPVIYVRRANCILACLDAQKTPPPTFLKPGTGRVRSLGSRVGLVAPSPQFRGSSSSSAFIHHQQQHTGQFPFPYSAYG
ncbi:unnamed protein product [Arabidopsis halleri]